MLVLYIDGEWEVGIRYSKASRCGLGLFLGMFVEMICFLSLT